MAPGHREEALNARLGLAYSLIKQGLLDQAILHLNHLVGQGYRPAETRLALTHALLQRNRWAEARAQIAQLPPAKRAVMEKRLLEARLLHEYRSLPPKADPPRHSPPVSGRRCLTASPNGWLMPAPRSRQPSCGTGSWIARCPRTCGRGFSPI
jgi:hypothetical protein